MGQGVYNSAMECLLNIRETSCSATTLLLRSTLVAWGLVQALPSSLKAVHTMQALWLANLMTHLGKLCEGLQCVHTSGLRKAWTFLSPLLPPLLFSNKLVVSSALSFLLCFRVWWGLETSILSLLIFVRKFKNECLLRKACCGLFKWSGTWCTFLPPPHSKFCDTTWLLVQDKSLYCLSFF